MVSDDILQDENLDQNDILFEELPTDPVKRQIIKPNARLKLAVNKIKKIQQTKKLEKPKKGKCEGWEMVGKTQLPRH